VAGKQKPDVKDEAAPSLLDELEKRLATDDGKPVQLRADADDIGGELLAIVSKGLYTNPLDCLREYAQNGVDAQAETITIEVTGNTVMIFDDGVRHGFGRPAPSQKIRPLPEIDCRARRLPRDRHLLWIRPLPSSRHHLLEEG
jgi:hypothetical protein